MARQRPDGIGWCDETWNPVAGCSEVGRACEHCWAARIAATRLKHRLSGFAAMVNGSPCWTGRVELRESELDRPLRWRKPRRIAVALMGDWMHEALPDEARDRILAVEALCPQHVFIHLTKRWQRQYEYLAGEGLLGCGYARQDRILTASRLLRVWNAHRPLMGWPLSNLIVGASAWDPPSAEEACRWLLQTPAACRLLCLEPLLEPVFLQPWLSDLRLPVPAWCGDGVTNGPNRIKWVVVGPETGPGARRCEISWIRNIVEQCEAVDVPVWVKALLDSRGRKIPFEQWPEDLRVRQLTEVTNG